jgi:signal peptidase I
MTPDDGKDQFGHPNPPPRRARKPATSDHPMSGSLEIPDPFVEDVGPDHPLASSGQAAVLPERGRARTRAVKRPALPPEELEGPTAAAPPAQRPAAREPAPPAAQPAPPAPPAQPPREMPKGSAVLTPGGVKRVSDTQLAMRREDAVSRQTTGPIRKVKSTPEEAGRETGRFHDQSRAKNNPDDVNWQAYAAKRFPSLAAEDFGVKTRKTDSGRVVPVAIRADLTDEALKDQSIKGKRGKRGPKTARTGADSKGPPRSLLVRIGESLRLRRRRHDEPEEIAEVAGEAPDGFARSGSLQPRGRRKRRTVLGLAWGVGVELFKILLLVLLLRAYVVQVSEVHGPSMEGSLVHGDHLVVERVTPLIAKNRDKTILGLPMFFWLPEVLTPELRRGDIVVLRSPEDPGQELVKRLIALPGDTLRFEGGRIWLRPEGEVGFTPIREDYLTARELQNPGGPPSSYLRHDLGSYLTEGRELRVPEDRVFVLGDNRSSSNDSRRWLEISVRQTRPPGVERLWAHKASIEGRVIFRVWPTSRAGTP